MIRVRKAIFYIQGEEIGHCEVVQYQRWGDLFYPHSTSFLCPRCGDAWGHIRIPFERFVACYRHCPDHGAGNLYPIDPWGVFRNYSPEILRYFVLTIPSLGQPQFFDLQQDYY